MTRRAGFHPNMPPISAQKGVIIYTVAFGDPDATGELRVDLPTLRQVASVTSGQFFCAEDGTQLEAIYTDIDRLAPVKLETLTWRPGFRYISGRLVQP